MSSLGRAFTTSFANVPSVTHGPISVTQREKAAWANEDHHSYSWWTRSKNGFVNPWKSFHKPSMLEMATGATFSKIEEGVHIVDERDSKEVEEESLNLVKPPSWGGHWSTRSVPEGSTPSKRVRVTWLGHAGSLVQLPPWDGEEIGFNILLDPIFSLRASPSQTVGPTRIVESPCSVEDLPPIHVVLLSHNQ